MAFQLQAGAVLNPRSQNVIHMSENLAAISLGMCFFRVPFASSELRLSRAVAPQFAAGEISEPDMQALWAAPQSICAPPACTNPVWEGCVNNGK